MKKIICQLCKGVWIIENDDLEKQTVCPYCGNSVQGKVEFKTYDTLDKVIYGAITKKGEGVLQNLRQLSGFMLDTAPNLKKEIRIFNKTMTDDYASYIRVLYEQEVDEAEMTIRRLRQLFIEEEGLSESWADMICDGLYGALLHYKGVGCTRLINVEVDDFELPKKNTESALTVPKQHSAGNKSNFTVKSSSKPSNNTSRSNITSSNMQYTTNGDPGGLCELALKYYYGTGGYKRDERKAIKLFRESANYHNYVPAYNYLGQVFVRKRDYDSASKWYQKSAAANNTKGLCMMGYFYQKGYGAVKQNTSSALKCYADATATGDFKQMVDIAVKFLRGSELPKEEKVAVDILDAAAKIGSAEAQFYLAKCYKDGTGVNADIGRAIALFKTAFGNGYQEAKAELEEFQRALSFSERLKYRIKG